MTDTDETDPRATPMRIMESVQELHRRGYHQVRILPGMNASGTSWRICIASTDHLTTAEDNDKQWWDDDTTMRYTSAQGARADASADWLLNELPRMQPTAADPAYTDWYAGLMELVQDNYALPVAYADYFDESLGWEIGWCSSIRYPAPPMM